MISHDLLSLGHATTKTGFQVILAGSGEEALEKPGTESTEPVTIDLMLPRLGGYE